MTKALKLKDKPLTKEQIQLITRTVAKGATQDELAMFLNVCKRAGLDPFTKQIHMVKRAGQVTIQVGIDGFRAIAERSGALAGIDDVVYDDEDADQPKKATVTVYRLVGGQKVPFVASARWKEYFPGDKMGFMWKKMPYLMLGKAAESLALRKAFPQDLSGLYTDEEMHQADDRIIRVEATPVTKESKAKNDEIAARMQVEKPEDLIPGETPATKGAKVKSAPGQAKAEKAFRGEVVEEESSAAKQMKAGMKGKAL